MDAIPLADLHPPRVSIRSTENAEGRGLVQSRVFVWSARLVEPLKVESAGFYLTIEYEHIQK